MPWIWEGIVSPTRPQSGRQQVHQAEEAIGQTLTWDVSGPVEYRRDPHTLFVMVDLGREKTVTPHIIPVIRDVHREGVRKARIALQSRHQAPDVPVQVLYHRLVLRQLSPQIPVTLRLNTGEERVRPIEVLMHHDRVGIECAAIYQAQSLGK